MIVLDSDVLIEAMERDDATLDMFARLAQTGEEFGTTSLNAAEFLRGYGEGPDLVRALRLLGSLSEIPFGPRAARRYGRIAHQLDRAGARVPSIDGMVAAATIEAG